MPLMSKKQGGKLVMCNTVYRNDLQIDKSKQYYDKLCYIKYKTM